MERTAGGGEAPPGARRLIALAGNPNVGKSTVFNALTGLRQHTGNWPGKTVALARGVARRGGTEYVLVDLPGTYSLAARSAEEEVARDFLLSGGADAAVVVCDATCLERGLILALQVMEITPRMVVCVNLLDEARKKGIRVDLAALEGALGVPVAGASARSGEGLEALMAKVEAVASGEIQTAPRLPEYPAPDEEGANLAPERARDRIASAVAGAAEAACARAVRREAVPRADFDRRLDAVLTGRRFGMPIMLLLLCGILWLSVTGANYPSELLSRGLFWVQDRLTGLFLWLGAPQWLHDALVTGAYRVLAWVVSVMLPPMAIFFPLFTLLEDFGYLPRVAFNLDARFKRAGACGRQALTMCMGLGCNAAGVTGCRIIDSPRERLIAVVTNSFVPCNGRFPTLIAIITMFFAGALGGLLGSALAAVMLTGMVLLGVGATFLASRLLSATVLKGEASSFTLELPPYRAPQVGRVLVRSLLDRTLFVLGRAAAAAAPAGLLLWAMAGFTVGGQSLLRVCADFLDPFARILGLDGVILIAFILGLPANEIVVPIILMAYLSCGSLVEPGGLAQLRALLVANGWTWVTAVSVLLFCLFHWPCSTTCMTIKKETGSLKWTALSVLLPTAAGLLSCAAFASLARLFGAA